MNHASAPPRPAPPAVDAGVLRAFEARFDPARGAMQDSALTLIGVGRLSHVFELSSLPGVALKRLPPFVSAEARNRHQRAVEAYTALLSEQLGMYVAGQRCIPLENARGEHLLYVAQTRMPADSIGPRVLERCTDEGARTVVSALLDATLRVWYRNEIDAPQAETGFDARLSNWSIELTDEYGLVTCYLDTTTPFFRRLGVDTGATDVFLSRVPPGVPARLRRTLADRLEGYYDLRTVLLDFVAELYDEGQADRVPLVLDVVNGFVERLREDLFIEPISANDVNQYHREETRFWRRFQRSVHMDRFIQTRVRGRSYPYLLPF